MKKQNRSGGVKKNILFFSIVVILLVLDQAAKFFVRKTLSLNQSVPILKNIFYITHTKNYGVAFGLLNYTTARWFLVIFSITAIILIFYYYKKIPKKKVPLIAVSLLLAGTLGNLIDRLIFGYVTDFIDFRIWPAFNVADSCITIAVILLIFWIWKS